MIKVTLGEKPKEEKPFPKLMIVKDGLTHAGRVVLFIKPTVGTIIKLSNGDYEKIGKYCEGWCADAFTDYNEPITLQNA